MDRGAAVLLTAFTGGLVALQAPINSTLGRSIGTWQAAFVSFAIGTVALALIASLATGGMSQIAGVRDVSLVYLTGGNANDTFLSLDSSWPLVAVDGGGGVDSMYVDDDFTENALPFRASLEPTLLTRDRGTIFDYYRMNIQFVRIEAATYECAPNTNRIDVYGTSSEIAPGLQWTILCGAASNSVR